MHTGGRGCKARRTQTGLSAGRGREPSPCKDGSRGGEKTVGSLCTIHRSAGKTSDAARREHCVSRRRQQTTMTTIRRNGVGYGKEIRKRASIARSDSETTPTTSAESNRDENALTGSC